MPENITAATTEYPFLAAVINNDSKDWLTKLYEISPPGNSLDEIADNEVKFNAIITKINTSNQGHNALTFVLSSKHPNSAVVQYLLDRGADIYELHTTNKNALIAMY